MVERTRRIDGVQRKWPPIEQGAKALLATAQLLFGMVSAADVHERQNGTGNLALNVFERCNVDQHRQLRSVGTLYHRFGAQHRETGAQHLDYRTVFVRQLRAIEIPQFKRAAKTFDAAMRLAPPQFRCDRVVLLNCGVAIANKYCIQRGEEHAAVTVFRFNQRLLGTQASQTRPDARRQFARQLNFVLAPVVRSTVVKTQRKTPLTVIDQRHTDERGDVERCEFQVVGAGVVGRIAHHNGFVGARNANELFLDKIGQPVHADQRQRIVAMPVMFDDHLLGSLVDLGKGANRQLKMCAQPRSDGLNHVADAGALQQVAADRGQKREIDFSLLARRDVARNRQQTRGFAVRVKNR